MQIICLPVMAQLSLVELEQGYTIESKSVYYSSAILASTKIALTTKDIKAQNKKERRHKGDKGMLIPLADAETFKDFGMGYGVDCNHVFYRGTIVENVDPASFVLLDKGYSKDKHFVFLRTSIILEADPKSFQPLNSVYSKDNRNVFYKTTKIEGADLLSFKVGGKGDYCFAYDNNYLYFHHNKEEIDIETFEIDEHSRSFRDKYHTYSLKSTSSGGLIDKDCYPGHEVDTYPVNIDTIPFRDYILKSITYPYPDGSFQARFALTINIDTFGRISNVDLKSVFLVFKP